MSKTGIKNNRNTSKVEKSFFNKFRVVFYIAAGLIVVGLGVIYISWSSQSVLDQKLIEQATFPIYAPKSAPNGFVVDSRKTELGGSLLTYSFSSETAERNITVTVQPLPSNFDMQKLIGSGTVSSSSTANGMLYDLSAGDISQYLLNTGDALIFLTSTTGIDTATITSLANDLVRHE